MMCVLKRARTHEAARPTVFNQNTMNHDCMCAINGEVRLCLESEGSPIQFRKVRVRELP